MPSQDLLCAQCGSAATSGLVCPRCGGGLVKVCAKCRFKNSPQKNYCDQCGVALSGDRFSPTPQAPDIPQTLIGGLPEAGSSPDPFFARTPLPGSTTSSFKNSSTTKRRRDAEPFWTSLFPSGLDYFVRSVAAILLLIAIAAAAGLFALQQLSLRNPKNVVRRLAERHLTLLAGADYASAYYGLSKASQVACPIDDFRLLLATTPWSWSNLQLVNVEPESIIVRYDLASPKDPPRPDYLFFAKDGDGWAIVFDDNILKSAQQDVDRKDGDMGFIHAQSAVELNPRDAAARALLCQAAALRRAPDQIERECALALETARQYPSRLSASDLYHVYAILGDTLYSRRKFADAAKAYTAMLAFPQLTDLQICQLTLARYDTLRALKQTEEARPDLETASKVCAANHRLMDLTRRRQAELSAESRVPINKEPR